MILFGGKLIYIIFKFTLQILPRAHAEQVNLFLTSGVRTNVRWFLLRLPVKNEETRSNTLEKVIMRTYTCFVIMYRSFGVEKWGKFSLIGHEDLAKTRGTRVKRRV